MFGMLKKLGFCNKSYFLSGDWLVTKKKKSWGSYLYCHVLFIAEDYLVCKLSDVVFNLHTKVYELRKDFYKRDISRNQIINNDWWLVGVKRGCHRNFINTSKEKICFLGNIKDSAGLDLIVRSLKTLTRDTKIKLKVMGPDAGQFDRYLDLARRIGLDGAIECLGYIESNRLEAALADCFCGLNLVTDKNDFSNYGMPGKILLYLQFLLPIITTVHAGYLATLVKKYDLGIVIEPDEPGFVNAVNKIHAHHAAYRDRILKFIDDLPDENLLQVLNNRPRISV
jgi:glycosyltransferase involved in cell wall biosynthesis